MARVRCITEMGMGVDVHGRDATKAARRAVSDAIRHSSLGFVRLFGKTPHDMFVDVTIAVPNPDAVDTAAVAKELPYGTVTVTAVKGGLEIPAESGGDAIIIANAAVIVSSRRREVSAAGDWRGYATFPRTNSQLPQTEPTIVSLSWGSS